jgi:3-oxoacyl-[acyl-carrier-protein] synthase II
MTAFINGIGLISPQRTSDPKDFLTEIVEHNTDYLKCLEPDYKKVLDPLLARRMSRLIKMGITSAKLCLQDAGTCAPDAIITGTGLGSVEDTEKILGTIHENEFPLNPTPFIQSTYNTISSQIAISLKCHGYNSTYVHRSFSFESGLQDALMQLEEKEAANILVGGIDEMTMNHLSLTRRVGHWKMGPVNNLRILKSHTKGALAGEGAGFFNLSSEKNDNTYARLVGVKTIYKPENTDEVQSSIMDFIGSVGLKADDIDMILTGMNGDKEFDPLYYLITDGLFPGKLLAYYKHLCGEYLTSTAFALWVASNILKRQAIPSILLVKQRETGSIRNILIYNQYRNVHHSLILVGQKFYK